MNIYQYFLLIVIDRTKKLKFDENSSSSFLFLRSLLSFFLSVFVLLFLIGSVEFVPFLLFSMNLKTNFDSTRIFSLTKSRDDFICSNFLLCFSSSSFAIFNFLRICIVEKSFATRHFFCVAIIQLFVRNFRIFR